MELPKRVRLIEVGPRDGLQDEEVILPVSTKLEFINKLATSGFKNIEVGSFVSANLVPQMNHSDDLVKALNRGNGVMYSALVPNLRGLERAIATKVDSIAIFMAASETFSVKNINCSINDSLSKYQEVIEKAKQNNLPIRGYLSCIFSCPYEGAINQDQVVKYAIKLHELGCYEIALGDTTGLGTPSEIASLINKLKEHIPTNKIAFHLHNTNGLALVNIMVALQYQISNFDCSIAGLGGCPFAKNATGNVASEDLVYMLNSLGIETGLNLRTLVDTSKYICNLLGHASKSSIEKIAKYINI